MNFNRTIQLLAAVFVSTVISSTSSFAATQFIVVGDTGQDNQGQQQVALAMGKHCSSEVCNFGVLAGDNIYPEGMTSVNDPILDTLFKKYYSSLKFPFLVTLGNHDYGRKGNSWERGSFQVEYSKKNPQYHLPAPFYYKVHEDFVLVVLDTNRMMWSKENDLAQQEAMVNEAYSKSKGKWFIVVGHHPYLSNGDHGNAGNYEGTPWPAFVSGRDVKAFIEKNVCGRAHLYLSGHDHNLQLTDGRISKCNTLHALSGAGASVEPLTNRNKTLFQAEELGFLAVNIEKDKMALRFIDSQNRLLHTTRLSLPARRTKAR